MIQDIFLHEPLSRNIYVRKSQIIERITKLRDIMQNQKFTNEIVYSFQTLHENIKHYKGLLKLVEKEIMLREMNVFIFGG